VIDSETHRRIHHLHNRYVRVIDDDQLEQWPQLFTAGGNYQVTTRENHERGFPLALMSCKGRGMMLDRITGLRKINVYEPHRYNHQISALEISAQPAGGFRCISNFLVVRIMHTGASMLFASGIYLDVVVQDEDGTLRFAERTVVTDSRQTDTLLVIPL
jgi:anthranilate 1,2-dioxygenase small subunit/terephthalate 1,2-dioxygenase oxygenase component beta subunit